MMRFKPEEMSALSAIVTDLELMNRHDLAGIVANEVIPEVDSWRRDNPAKTEETDEN